MLKRDPWPVSDTVVTPSSAADTLPDRLLAMLRIRITGYRLIEPIRTGGQAIVFKAAKEETGRPVAIKVLRGGMLADPASRDRLQREARILAALNHPNIVEVLDTGQTDEGYEFLVMNYVPGRPLDEVMREWQEQQSIPPLTMLLRLFIKVCDAVHAAHLAGVTHRDLSPSNILIDERGEPHVLDFGLARTAFDHFITSSQQGVSMTGQFLGKLEYASPEQVRGEHHKVDIRTDVYSLGIILYQFITGGRFPYSVEGHLNDAINAILFTPPAAPEINSDLDGIVLRALAKPPGDRYQSAGEFARDLGRYLEGSSPVEAVPKRSFERRKLIAVLIVLAISAVGMVLRLGALRDHWLQKPLQSSKTTPAPATARPIDLLRSVRLPDDALNGVWESNGFGYMGRSPFGGRLRLRSDTLGAYDVRFRFSKPGAMVGLRFTFGGRKFVWYFDVNRGAGTGFGVTDDARSGDVWLAGSPARQSPRFTADQHYTALLQVRHDSFVGYIDDQPAIRWNVDPALLDIKQDWNIRAGGLEFVCQFDGSLHEAEVISIPNAPSVVAAVPQSGEPKTNPAPPAQLGAPVDLLALLDQTDLVSDQYWKRTDQGLLSLTTGVGSIDDPQILRIPYHAQVEYDLRVTFTYQRQPGLVLVLLSHSGKRFNFVTQGGSAGFFPVNGAHAHENPSSLIQWTRSPEGLRQVITLRIRNRHVSAELDGRLISEMTTDYSDLKDSHRFTGQIAAFDFGLYAASATIHSAEVIPVLPPPAE